MIPELGHFALWLALGASLVAGIVPMLGAARDRGDWMALARPSARIVFALVAFSFVCLAVSFATNDFSVAYVATNSNRLLPLHYRIAAVWGGHEGSILLWLLMLTFWAAAVAQFSRHLPETLAARILAVMAWLSFGFLLFLLVTSNPFDRLFPAAPEGRDLNPLLQDPGMVIHPPMLYMGYVGLSVAFAFAVAALIGGDLDAAWARWTRPWTTAAWIFLTIGIALGSGWAYYELGWGGWWFWDPVENASFMPWLVATALIHSLAVTEKRGSFKSWTVLLAILAFSLSLLGTFLVRSGVLSSVHAFATDPRRGLFILAFLVIVIGSSLALYAWRAANVGLGARFALLSRETLLLANNVLLVVACGAVLLGTLYPLALDALNLGKISVGPPYFDTVFVPLLTPLVFLMGIGPLARWKEARLPELATRLRWAAGTAVVATIVAVFVARRHRLRRRARTADGVLDRGVGRDRRRRAPVARRRRARRPDRARAADPALDGRHVRRASRRRGLHRRRDAGEDRRGRARREDGGRRHDRRSATTSSRSAACATSTGPNYRAAQGTIEVTNGGKAVTTLHPEKRIYTATQAVMTDAAIDPGFRRDLYVSLGEPIVDDATHRPTAWIVRIYYKPFVDWIWGGCGVMALGGLLAATDRRYRSRKSASKATTSMPPSMPIAPRDAVAT